MYEIATETVRDFMRTILPTEPPFAAERARWFYRGQAEATWKLAPTSRRKDAWDPFGGTKRFGLECEGGFVTDTSERLVSVEETVFRRFSAAAVEQGLAPHLSASGPAMTAYARHIGLPTRVLDWTRNVWVAAYFAASSALLDPEAKGPLALYAMKQNAVPELGGRVSLLEFPTAGNANLIAQHGVLIELHDGVDLLDSFGPVEPKAPGFVIPMKGPKDVRKAMVRVTLPLAEAPRLLQVLRDQRVHAGTMFPGPDGYVRLLKELAVSDAADEDDLRRKVAVMLNNPDG